MVKAQAEIAQMTGVVAAEAAGLRGFLSGLSRDEWLAPSACAEWTVGDVVAHLTQSAETWSENIQRAQAGDASPPPGQQFLHPGDRGSQVMAQRAIGLRQETGPEELLQRFANGYHQFGEVMAQLRPVDWGKPCFHRRGLMPLRDYVGLRVQELAIHGWDIRWAFDGAAEPSEQTFGVLLTMVPRWLTNTFSQESAPDGPVRFRFEVPGPVEVHEDVVVGNGAFRVEPVTAPPSAQAADVTFRCNTGNYFLWLYGRLELDQAIGTGRLVIEGDRDLAARFDTLFQGV